MKFLISTHGTVNTNTMQTTKENEERNRMGCLKFIHKPVILQYNTTTIQIYTISSFFILNTELRIGHIK